MYEERDITATTKRGWYTYDHTPRYGTNYYGMRGRVSILSEAYSHDPFRKRVASTYAFVKEVLSATARHSAELMKTRSASENVAESDVPIRSRLTTKPFEVPIPFEVLVHTGDSVRTQPGVPKGVRRTGRFVTQLMPVYDRFEPSLSVRKPDAYLVPNDPKIAALLRLHDLVVTPFSSNDGFTRASMFVVDSVIRATREFQGHRETHLTGRWGAPGGTKVPEPGQGKYVVVSSQGRFGPLAAYLLEPESDDGLVDWNFFDDRLGSGASFPILRLYRQ